jgi:hypothetical protein
LLCVLVSSDWLEISWCWNPLGEPCENLLLVELLSHSTDQGAIGNKWKLLSSREIAFFQITNV